MSSTSSIENPNSPLDWLEGALIVFKESLTIFPTSEYSKVAELVKKYLLNNQKTPENLFYYLKNKSFKSSTDHILLGFSLEHGIGTIPNLTKAFLEYQKAANAKDSFRQFFLGYCYNNGIGTSQDRTGNLLAQTNLATCYINGLGTTKNNEKAFKLYSKAAEAGYSVAQTQLRTYYINGLQTMKDLEKEGNPCPQTNIEMYYLNGLGTAKSLEEKFEFYLKAAEMENQIAQYNLGWCYQNRWGTTKNLLKAFEIYSKADQNDLGYFEAFFDLLSDEFKCLKCGNLVIIINRSPICPFCDTGKRDNNIHFSVNLVNHYDLPRFGEHGIEVGEGGFGVIKKGSWERGKILFWDKKNQKYERSGVTKVALKYLNDSQSIKYINSDEFIAHLDCASCKYILECYGITKDIISDEFIMVLPFAEHGDLRAFLKMNETTLTWEMFLRILFQIVSGLRFIHDSNLVHGDLHPGNILVLKTNPLKVVISDLGFCRPANYSPQRDDIFGVVQYSAP
ncbi:hypothetical protein G9A89_013174 [Geosiphon pyriformis]|nr:hypothetical protein G9A89_013174 [Geosiphon pyriformis]